MIRTYWLLYEADSQAPAVREGQTDDESELEEEAGDC